MTLRNVTAVAVHMTRWDHHRLLLLIGWVVARISDYQFERAGLTLLAGLFMLAVMHWLFDPWFLKSPSTNG